MQIKFNIPSANQLFGKTSLSDKNNKAGHFANNVNEPKNVNQKNSEKEKIVTYFYHNFYGQAKFVIDEKTKMPKSELEINLSIDILYQAKVKEKEDFKTLEEMAKQEGKNKEILNEENTSKRIFDAAKDYANGDLNKLKNTKNLIKRGFDKAMEELSETPEISKITLNKTLQKIDNYLSNIPKKSINIIA